MDNQDIEQLVLDKMTRVCLCRVISRKSIKDAIRAGAKTVGEVNKVTGSGSGQCGGQRCGPKITELLRQFEAGEWQ